MRYGMLEAIAGGRELMLTRSRWHMIDNDDTKAHRCNIDIAVAPCGKSIEVRVVTVWFLRGY